MTEPELQHIEQYRVPKAPDTVYYIPNFISKEEEKYLTQQVYGAPKPKWKQLSNRRLQNWGGLPHPKGMIAEKLPKWLEVYCQQIADLGVFRDLVPNHVLVNEYQPGQGIMPHEDGPLFHPVVTTISLGSHTFLDFYQHRGDASESAEDLRESKQESDSPSEDTVQHPILSLLLQPCSLLILKDHMYTSFLHGIAERTQDIVTDSVANLAPTDQMPGDRLERSCRISLTIRHVPKTLKMKLFGKR
ncbi:alpha-ketoglutarate-dependent dioxygenase alkB homolog 6-like [Acanthaster planci]|uniref:Alpha-ketoglutarate-dependent dioxygenase alkB homolog 6-like n=1 Tax=Acanthaster planci TaxID=133434 RepID=A0A8B7YZP4_ACAPL|nr:alpha-ketoglutarate-dependent dioxygenase alkB homolog 6-like [Acanthaster planci]